MHIYTVDGMEQGWASAERVEGSLNQRVKTHFLERE
jgi:hypothetical protein